MSNGNKGPWYKSPVIMVPVIVAIIGAIGVIIAAYVGIIPFMGPELATVRGIVTDNDGKPVIGAVVEIDGLAVTTGGDGGYVIRGIPINTRTITVRAPGAEVVNRALRISKGDEIIMYDIILPPPVTLPPPTPTPSPSPSPIPSPSPSPTPTPTLSIEAGWEYQTYVDSQGITAVQPEEDQLVLQAHLIDGDPNYSKGEIYLDLRSADVPDLKGKVPINMIGKEISALVKAPKDFVGDPSHPNGVQVFAKDSDWKSQYGPWKNIQRPNTWITVTLSPTKEKIPMGYTDIGFDPTDIIMIGVKFGMGTGSNAKYDGPLYVKDIQLILSG